MLTPMELRELWRDLAGSQVLSVYLDTRVTDPAMRDSWRLALAAAIRTAGAHLTGADQRARFDRAAAFLREPSPPPGGVWSAPGWVAFATEDGLRHATDLPVRPAPVAMWRQGPVIAPYVRALKQHRPVLVALVESRAVRLSRYALGSLEALEELVAPGEEAAPGRAAASAPGTRGAVDSEAAARRRLAAFHRLITTVGERLEALAGESAWVLIGGTSEWAHLAYDQIRRQFEGRILLSPTLHRGASAVEMVRAAKDAATELRGAHDRVILDQLLDRASGHARAAAGLPDVQRALRAGAVDLLLLSPECIRTQETVAEDTVRAAFAGGATIEVPSGDAAEELDRSAGGVAARLRFPTDGLPEPPAARAYPAAARDQAPA